MLDIFLLIIGLFGLWVGAELAIKATLNLAEHFTISPKVIGLTVLALGTDLPELFIASKASLQRLQGTETSGLVLGEVMGSCFGQIGIALGIAGLSGLVTIRKKTVLREGGMLLASIILLIMLGFDGQLSRTDGLIMILFYLFYFGMILREERLHRLHIVKPKLEAKEDILAMIGGFMLLVFASDLTVESGVAVSQHFQIPQVVVGVLVLGFGTSLPEIATSLTAVRKNAGKMALGNLVGSNVFDLLFVVGTGSVISGFSVSPGLLTRDFPLLLLFSTIVVLLLISGMKLRRWESITLLVLAVSYFAAKGLLLI